MPICIECGYKLATLYTTYSKADDRTLGKGVRLTQCPRCKRFADKYVEHDYVVIFIDLVLIKPQVYRHLLFNRIGHEDGRFDPSIIRLGVLLLLFDVYLTWARIEKATSPPGIPLPQPQTPASPSPAHHSLLPGSAGPTDPFSPFLASQPIILQYLFFLTLCLSETAAFHMPIRWLLGAFPSSGSRGPSDPTSSSPFFTPAPPPPPHHPSAADADTAAMPEKAEPSRWIPHYPHPHTISTLLLVSSFTKLFPLLLLIWSYDLPSSASAVSWAVIVNNVAALNILLDCGLLRAVALAAVGALSRGLVGWAVLSAVGVEGGVAAAGVVETGDLVEGWKRAVAFLGYGLR